MFKKINKSVIRKTQIKTTIPLQIYSKSFNRKRGEWGRGRGKKEKQKKKRG